MEQIDYIILLCLSIGLYVLQQKYSLPIKRVIKIIEVVV